MFGEISTAPPFGEPKAHRGALAEPLPQGSPVSTGSVPDLSVKAPATHSDTAKRRRPAVVSGLPAADPLARPTRGIPVGILVYLASIGIVAIATVGVLFGIGFSLLVHPADPASPAVASRSGGTDVGSLLSDLVPRFFRHTAAADAAKVVAVPTRAELPRAAALAPVFPAPVAQPPAAEQLPLPEPGGTAPPLAVADTPGSGADNAPIGGEAKAAEAGGPAGPGAPFGATSDPPSSAAIPPATAVAPSGSALNVAELLARGDGYLGKGDVTSARLYYERAADAGSRQAAMRLGATFDANFLGRAGLAGTRGDQARADMWYRRARGLGTAEAASEPKGQETK